jgi:thiamine pyrophosphate-dependent acetolactate synthase large subunit-like protein
MKVYEAVATAFVKEGTSIIFGLMGDGVMTWWSEMSKHPDIQIVDVRNEGGALSMAEGWTRMTGEVGVCSTTLGPGLSRLATSLIVSSRGNFPLVICASSAPLNDNEKNNAQYLDQDRFVTAMGAGYIEILTPGFAAEAVRQAFYRARVEARPVVVSMPLDVQNKEYDGDLDDYEPSSVMFAGQQRIRPDVQRLNEAARIIEASRKPVILIGRGAIWSQALQPVRQLAQRIGALVSTTLLTKGRLGDEDFHAGISGVYSSRVAKQLFEQADCVLAVGASLNRYTLEGGYLYPNARVIHVDIAQHVVMAGSNSANCYIQGDAATTVVELDELLARRKFTNTGFRTPEVREALAKALDDPETFEVEPGTLDPRDVVRIIDERAPPNACIGYGNGHQKEFSLMGIKKYRPRQFTTVQFGCIGQGLPTAIGAALAMKEAPTIMIDGDGSALQNIQELDTAARLRVKLLYVIMNDEAYGAEYHKLISKKLNRNLSLVRSPDFAAVAAGFGCGGRVARTLEEVELAIEEFLRGEGPMVLDVRISRNVVSIPYRRLYFGQDA